MHLLNIRVQINERNGQEVEGHFDIEQLGDKENSTKEAGNEGQ